jgi:hypothetical protein
MRLGRRNADALRRSILHRRGQARDRAVSALTPHIRVLRAEAAALDKSAEQYESIPPSPERVTGIIVFRAFAAAKRAAADQLAAEDAALQPPREGKDQPITYDPKGKR